MNFTERHFKEKHYMGMLEIVKTFKPKLIKDGNAWICLYGEDLQSGLAGDGDTPLAAIKSWYENFREPEVGELTLEMAQKEIESMFEGFPPSKVANILSYIADELRADTRFKL
jgi:hypothetical protein